MVMACTSALALLVFWCRSCTAALLRPAFSHSGDHPLVRPLEGSEFLSACATAPVAVILFHGERCRKCVAFTPKFVRLAKEYQGQAQFFKLSVNRNAELCAAEHVLTLLPWCVLETQATAHPVRAPVSHSRASQRQHLRWGLLRTTSLRRRCVLDQKPTTRTRQKPRRPAGAAGSGDSGARSLLAHSPLCPSPIAPTRRCGQSPTFECRRRAMCLRARKPSRSPLRRHCWRSFAPSGCSHAPPRSSIASKSPRSGTVWRSRQFHSRGSHMTPKREPQTRTAHTTPCAGFSFLNGSGQPQTHLNHPAVSGCGLGKIRC